MPKHVKHGRRVRMHMDIEPELASTITELSEKLGIKRAKLTRILVKHGAENIQASLLTGDYIVTEESVKKTKEQPIFQE